ncbi:hypothetical protein ABT337_14700 [Saccharopolyspora hirsuta]|nr:hypothetical protein [Saccharopolyspora hirsuta]
MSELPGAVVTPGVVIERPREFTRLRGECELLRARVLDKLQPA